MQQPKLWLTHSVTAWLNHSLSHSQRGIKVQGDGMESTKEFITFGALKCTVTCTVLQTLWSSIMTSVIWAFSPNSTLGKDVFEPSKGHFTENWPLFWLRAGYFRGKLAPFLGLSGILSAAGPPHLPIFNTTHPHPQWRGRQQQLSNLFSSGRWWKQLFQKSKK